MTNKENYSWLPYAGLAAGIGIVAYGVYQYFNGSRNAVIDEYKYIIGDIVAEEDQWIKDNQVAGINGFTQAQTLTLKTKQGLLAGIQPQVFSMVNGIQGMVEILIAAVAVVGGGAIAAKVFGSTNFKDAVQWIRRKVGSGSTSQTDFSDIDYCVTGADAQFHLLAEIYANYANAIGLTNQASAIQIQMQNYCSQVTIPQIATEIANYSSILSTLQQGTALYQAYSQMIVMAQIEASGVQAITSWLPEFSPVI